MVRLVSWRSAYFAATRYSPVLFLGLRIRIIPVGFRGRMGWHRSVAKAYPWTTDAQRHLIQKSYDNTVA